MFFENVPEAKPDAIFGLTGSFKADPRPHKINLLVGIYKDEELRSSLLPSVKKAKEEIFSEDLLADYLPMDGLSALSDGIGSLVFSEAGWQKEKGRIYGGQMAGGTGALRAGAEFLRAHGFTQIALPQQTWPNHEAIFGTAGFQVGSYPYYSASLKGLDQNALLQGLQKLPEKSAVLFHACCQNPTGLDPTFAQWKEISQIVRKKQLLPIFDFAYQGFGEGLDQDAAAIRLFLQEGHELVVSYSCSKNFSLYCQRVGALFIVTSKEEQKRKVGSQVCQKVRALYSNPPAHGARIVSYILSHPVLKQQWQKEVEEMRKRIFDLRQGLVQQLMAQARHTDFRYLSSHKGMFSFVHLQPHQTKRLIDEFGIYMLENGRMNVAGITEKNREQVVKGLIAVCES